MEKLPLKTSGNPKQNRNHRKAQSFWNEELQNLWNTNCMQWFSVGQNYPTWLPSKFSTTLEPPLIFGKFLQSSAGTTPIYEHLNTMQEMMSFLFMFQHVFIKCKFRHFLKINSTSITQLLLSRHLFKARTYFYQ